MKYKVLAGLTLFFILALSNASSVAAQEVEYSGLYVDPIYADPGANITASAWVNNTGTSNHTYVANLTINGYVALNKTGTLEPGQSVELAFLVTEDIYDLYVDTRVDAYVFNVSVGDLPPRDVYMAHDRASNSVFLYSASEDRIDIEDKYNHFLDDAISVEPVSGRYPPTSLFGYVYDLLTEGWYAENSVGYADAGNRLLRAYAHADMQDSLDGWNSDSGSDADYWNTFRVLPGSSGLPEGTPVNVTIFAELHGNFLALGGGNTVTSDGMWWNSYVYASGGIEVFDPHKIACDGDWCSYGNKLVEMDWGLSKNSYGKAYPARDDFYYYWDYSWAYRVFDENGTQAEDEYDKWYESFGDSMYLLSPQLNKTSTTRNNTLSFTVPINFTTEIGKKLYLGADADVWCDVYSENADADAIGDMLYSFRAISVTPDAEGTEIEWAVEPTGALEHSNLSVSPSLAFANQSIEVTATVYNPETSTINYTVPVTANGIVQGFATGEVSPQSEKVITYNLSLIHPGTYDVGLAGLQPVRIKVASPEGIPDLRIAQVRPVQVVFDSDVNGDGILDLVEDKELAVLVTLEGDNLDKIDQSVTLSLIGSWGTQEIVLSPEELRNVTESGEEVVMGRMDIAPTGTGDQNITVIVDSKDSVEEWDETNNEYIVTVTVKDTKPFSIYYFRVVSPKGEDSKCCSVESGGYPAVTHLEYDETINHSDRFVIATFPIPESEYSSRGNSNYFGHIHGAYEMDGAQRVCTWEAIAADVSSLDYHAYRLSGGTADRSVGVVETYYFVYHTNRADIAGLTWQGSSVVFVSGNGADKEITENNITRDLGEWKATITAHELGHTYGLYIGGIPEEYDVPGIDFAEGYWVKEGKHVSGVPAFMEGGDEWWDYGAAWIDNQVDHQDDMEDYNKIFARMLVDPADPPKVLYVKGLIKSNGSAESLPWHYHENVLLSNIQEGDYSFVGLNANGEKVLEQPFDARFTVYIDTKNESYSHQTDVAPYSFAMEYPLDVVTLQLWHKGEVLEEFDTASKLLHDTVDNLPDEAFATENQTKIQLWREELHDLINDASNESNSGEFGGASSIINSDLRNAVDRWILDNYTSQDPMNTDKEQLLTILEDSVDRFDNAQTLKEQREGSG